LFEINGYVAGKPKIMEVWILHTKMLYITKVNFVRKCYI